MERCGRAAGWSPMIDHRYRYVSLANNVVFVCVGVIAVLALVLWFLL